ncbi:OPA3 [Mytilus coruscus]|uniref:OPA3 n=1 Tax=Mytilus coruscus TaxID=42192 RepID=A0A6J8D2I5_MYTCO|nr:OPA3 [Mytilus coruscus]
MVLPIVKLVTLLIRQFTRPIVHRLSVLSKRNQTFRSIIVPAAQRYHSMDCTVQNKLLGVGERVEALSEDEAFRVGTKLLGETLAYAISASFLLYEYNRSSRREQVKEEKRKDEIEKLQSQIHEYGTRTETEIKYLRRRIVDLEDKNLSLANYLSSLKSG